jgi:hypothetical protein
MLSPRQAPWGLDGAALALHSGLLNLQVGEGLSLNRKLIGKAVALGVPSFVVRGAVLGRGRKCCRLHVKIAEESSSRRLSDAHRQLPSGWAD